MREGVLKGVDLRFLLEIIFLDFLIFVSCAAKMC